MGRDRDDVALRLSGGYVDGRIRGTRHLICRAIRRLVRECRRNRTLQRDADAICGRGTGIDDRHERGG